MNIVLDLNPGLSDSSPQHPSYDFVFFNLLVDGSHLHPFFFLSTYCVFFLPDVELLYPIARKVLLGIWLVLK